MQIVFMAPLILSLLVFYFIGGPFVWGIRLLGFNVSLGLYNERDGRRDHLAERGVETDPARARLARFWLGFKYPRMSLAWVARLPLSLLRQCVAPDSGVATLAENLDNQMAFWEMQRFGVEAGQEAAAFLARLLTRQYPTEGGAVGGRSADSERQREAVFHAPRLHFVGHSFGGLVVANAARLLALRKAESKAGYEGVRLHSLTLLQSAFASSWFEKEETLRRSMGGAVANIYSRYDTANGFYYPLANSGRQAAGAVGLTGVGRQPITNIPYPVGTVGKGGRLASLVEPPPLQEWIEELARRQHNLLGGVGAGAGPDLINLDASRLISEGPVALGGGHGDIFKDDVVNLVWAVSLLNTPMSPPTAETAPAPGSSSAPGPSGPVSPRGGGGDAGGVVLPWPAVVAAACGQAAMIALLLARRRKSADGPGRPHFVFRKSPPDLTDSADVGETYTGHKGKRP